MQNRLKWKVKRRNMYIASIKAYCKLTNAVEVIAYLVAVVLFFSSTISLTTVKGKLHRRSIGQGKYPG